MFPCKAQQNGLAERRNRTLVDLARSMLAQDSLPLILGDAILATLNHMTTQEGLYCVVYHFKIFFKEFILAKC